MMFAVQSGDAKQLQRLTGSKQSGRRRDEAEEMERSISAPSCLLHLAADHGHDHLIEHLIQMGGDLEQKDGMGRTVLARAARYGHASMVERLIEAGAIASAVDQFGYYPATHTQKL